MTKVDFPPLSDVRAIELLVLPSVQWFDVRVVGPVEVFATANQIVGKGEINPPYELRIVAPGLNGVVALPAFLGLTTCPHPPASRVVDTLLIAGGPGIETGAAADPALVDWIRERGRQARRIASVCTGAFLLAASGVLDGRRAATHWSYCADLAERFPAVHVEPDLIVARDGRFWTSAGMTAGIDLALALVEEDLGRTVTSAVARDLLVFPKRAGGQAQFCTTLSPKFQGEFGPLHDWIRKHLRMSMPVSILAKQVGMSERSFLRHYTKVTGVTPARAVEKLRIESASKLLSESPLPIQRIVRHCGFGSDETMRRSFLRVLAVTPQDYRDRFSA